VAGFPHCVEVVVSFSAKKDPLHLLFISKRCGSLSSEFYFGAVIFN
jgi:hypothetical protein